MSTIGTLPNLLDAAKLTGADGKILRTAELLTKLSPMIEDLPFQEGNLSLGHRVNVRTTLPSPTSRRLNQRVLPTKSTTDQNDEQCMQLVDYSQVDATIANLNGNMEQYRMNEAMAHLQGMTHEFERQVVYGNSGVVQEELDGLIPRMAAASDTVIDAGASGSDNASIVCVGWGMTTVYGIYPKGSKAGIEHENLGKVTSETSAGLMEVYRDRWELNAGIAVEDPRYLAAIRAIDVSTLVADPTGATTNLIDNMIEMIHGIYKIDSPLIKPRIYMPRTIFMMLDIQANRKSNLYLQSGNADGKPFLNFRGIPIRVCDAMTETEAVI